MKHIVATRDGVRPSAVILKISGEETQPVARIRAAFLEHGAHIGFALQMTHRRAHLMAGGQELQNGVAADKPGSAGDQNSVHLHPPSR